MKRFSQDIVCLGVIVCVAAIIDAMMRAGADSVARVWTVGLLFFGGLIMLAGLWIDALAKYLAERRSASRSRAYRGRQRLGVVVLLVSALATSACATYVDPRPSVVYMPRVVQGEALPQVSGVPEYLRQIVRGTNVSINLPDEIRGVAIDYFRAAGATITDGHQVQFTIDSRSRTETAYGRYVDVRINGQSRYLYVVEIEIKTADARRQLIFRGRGDCLYYTNQSECVAIAGRRALINLH